MYFMKWLLLRPTCRNKYHQKLMVFSFQWREPLVIIYKMILMRQMTRRMIKSGHHRLRHLLVQEVKVLKVTQYQSTALFRSTEHHREQCLEARFHNLIKGVWMKVEISLITSWLEIGEWERSRLLYGLLKLTLLLIPLTLEINLMNQPLFKSLVKVRIWSSGLLVWRRKWPLLDKNNTWKLVDKPLDKKVIGYKWVFKKKSGIHGVESARNKARVVAKGFSQVEGVDYLISFLWWSNIHL